MTSELIVDTNHLVIEVDGPLDLALGEPIRHNHLMKDTLRYLTSEKGIREINEGFDKLPFDLTLYVNSCQPKARGDTTRSEYMPLTKQRINASRKDYWNQRDGSTAVDWVMSHSLTFPEIEESVWRMLHCFCSHASVFAFASRFEYSMWLTVKAMINSEMESILGDESEIYGFGIIEGLKVLFDILIDTELANKAALKTEFYPFAELFTQHHLQGIKLLPGGKWASRVELLRKNARYTENDIKRSNQLFEYMTVHEERISNGLIPRLESYLTQTMTDYTGSLKGRVFGLA